MSVSFPGGVAVDATYRGHTVHTDQPLSAGGADTAMSPFDLFLASIGTCMGFYALRFCQERNLSTEGLGLTLEPLREGDGKRMTALRIAVELPSAFPEKYRGAIERAIDHCAVKNQIVNPPRFELLLNGGSSTASAVPPARPC
ncbi:MAG: OsmC family protein [Acidobacteria bacterium]|nr:OsmC family protein [Acidobacteriota bacterium]MBV9186772.1 OsmC family protein [Acidobacteriota bacterium]